jgi:putative endopeptidase
MHSRFSLSILALSSLALVAACTPTRQEEMQRAQPPAAASTGSRGDPVIGTWGFDLTGMDAQVHPGDDFFRYASGSWLQKTAIPADKSAWGMFEQLREQAEADVAAIIRELADSKEALTPRQRQIVDAYAAFLDQQGIDARGLAPAQPGLSAIAGTHTHEDIAKLMGRADLALRSPIAFGVTLDQKNPDRYVVAITHGGLGLPDREYYLKDEPRYVDIRARYLAHIERLLTLANQPEPAAAAATVLKLETEIAQRHWPRARRRERDLTYNPHDDQQLHLLAPSYPWAATFAAAELGEQRFFIVRERDAIPRLAELFAATPVSAWQSYLTYHYLRDHAAVLPQTIDREVFDFYGRTLEGQPEQRERWKRAVAATNAALGEAVGEIYVQRHFPPQARARMQELVENLRKAYAQRIDGLEWMSDATRRAAHEKLAAFRAKIAHPQRWRDYSALVIRADDPFGNAARSEAFDWRRDLDRLRKPSDRDEWRMTPQTVNAYYNAAFNEIVFPAAILQPPFFDPNADPAVNYGAIGGVIGHEMGHGFDDQGSKSDGRGILRTWWQPADEAAFRKLGDRLDAQYSGFTALPGLNVNGRLTLGENIGDLGGLSVALAAYRLSLDHGRAPVIDGFSGEQRFFLGWAQVWRGLYRDERLRSHVLTNTHSPPQFRVNGVVRNMDAWYSAFAVGSQRALYLDPEQRVQIW